MLALGIACTGEASTLGPARAEAATPQAAEHPAAPTAYPSAPRIFEVDGKEAFRAASADPNVAKETAEHGRLTTRLEVREDAQWQVGFFDSEDKEVAQVHVDGLTGDVVESWTGDQVAWTMARGYPRQFGHALNAPWVWGPMALIFLLGLVDWRRLRRVAHLDLLVLLSFGVSQAFFNDGQIGVSVPLAYPPLLYLLGRMLWIGFRGAGAGLRPSAPRLALIVACLFAIAFRITLNAVDSGVIDVGYAGVVGADRITHGEPIYGEGRFPDEVAQGDTYGPANYYAYVPFETALPWSGEWDDLPSAHGAAMFFDLATVLGLVVLGLRLRGRGHEGQMLAATLAFAWLTYPYTDFALQSNSNDSLVALFLVWGLAALASPVGRGVLVGLASMVKFAPLALVPLYAVGERGLADRLDGWRTRWPALRTAVVGAAAALFAIALMLAHPTIDPGLATFYERTVASQLDRESPFSIWGQVDGLEWLQRLVLIAAGALAVAVAFRPARRNVAQVAALAAAVVIATQLSVDHWFYLYIPWFCGLVFVALACGAEEQGGSAFRVCAAADV